MNLRIQQLSSTSAAAPVLDQHQGQLQQGLQNAGLGKDTSTLVASLASGGAAAIVGATASGGSVAGGATAFNADVNNRQIGAQERILARSLADQAKETGLKKPDGSAYTQADIENAMRNSSRSNQQITQGMLVDPNDPKGITDKGASFTAGGDGKTLVQVNQDGSNLNPNMIDLRLAAYIVQKTGGANTPYRDLYNRVQTANAGPPTNPNAGLNTITPNQKGQVTAEAAAGLSGVKNPVRDVNDIRRDVADGAEVVSRGAGIVGSTATAASKIPGPHQSGAATTAVVATGVGFAADVIEQVARPDIGKGIVSGTLNVIVDKATPKIPLLAPLFNEIGETVKNSDLTEKVIDEINTRSK